MKKYETKTFSAKEVFNRDALADSIKSKDPVIIFRTDMDKALQLTVEKQKKLEKRHALSNLAFLGGAVALLVTSYLTVPLLLILGGSLGSLGEGELKKYDFYEMEHNSVKYYLLLRKKKVNAKLDTIFYDGKKIL